VDSLDKLDIIFTFEQNEYARAVQQYLLAGRIVRKRDFIVLPLLLLGFLTALYYTRLNQWVLILTLLCLAAVLLICYIYFLKPQYDYYRKPHIGAEAHLVFTEEGVFLPHNGAENGSGENAAITQQENQGLRERTPSVEPKKALRGKRRPSFIRWDMFDEAWESREFFFLILEPHIYHIIPKRSFTNQVELQYFLKMLYRRVGIVETIGPYFASR
jgi:Ca2+/Na+ antiporter